MQPWDALFKQLVIQEAPWEFVSPDRLAVAVGHLILVIFVLEVTISSAVMMPLAPLLTEAENACKPLFANLKGALLTLVTIVMVQLISNAA
jgi:hypothetical protein